jgi:glycosyltransferase involved in cell wall biosynthesis
MSNRQGTSESLDLNIIIPVYNEGENIGRTLSKIAQVIGSIKYNTQITIVYDFDKDNTLPVVESLRSEYPLCINLQKNSSPGVCSAIREGIMESTSTFLLVTMADMSDDYDKLAEMMELGIKGFDIVCGSRYATGGHQYGGPFIKRTLSRIAGLSLHWLTGIPTHDITNSYKLYRRSIFEKIKIESIGGFEIGIEIVVKAFKLGMKITEVPCSWWDRVNGESRFDMAKWIPLYMKWYIYAFKSR